MTGAAFIIFRFRFVAVILRLCAIAVASGAALAQSAPVDNTFASVIRIAQQRVVKIYGGGIGREHGYGSGVLISADGEIVTTLSVMLESPGMRVVLADGRRFPGKVVARDERRQLAFVKIDATDLPCFELREATPLKTGEWVLAAANPFKVAEGAEPVSVTIGIFAGRARLDARRRNQEIPFDGEILLTDVIVSSPGSAGGALVNLNGDLVGVIGKAAFSDLTNTWLNYALPVEEVAEFARAARDGTLNEKTPQVADGSPTTNESAAQSAATWKTANDLGIRLFTLGGRAKPAYVDSVRAATPAKAAGLRPNDLILAANGRKTASCDDFDTVLKSLAGAAELELVVKRGEEIVTLTLKTGGGAKP